MYIGKKKCRVLRGIRKKVAEANGISYNPHKCNHKGDCEGTCPACEQEMRHIESELNKRIRMGKAAAVVGTAIGISVLSAGMSSCKPFEVKGDVPNDTTLMGEVADSTVYPSDSADIDMDSAVVKFTHKDGSTNSDIAPQDSH